MAATAAKRKIGQKRPSGHLVQKGQTTLRSEQRQTPA